MCQIRELTGFDVKTIRSHLHLFKNGGIEALKHRKPYRPKDELDQHKRSIEQEFQQRPPASILWVQNRANWSGRFYGIT